MIFFIVKNFDVLKSKEELIYDLIFTEKVDFNINISDYVDDIYNYEDFVSEIKKILKKSKVKIISSVVKLDSKTATWELKVKK
jgi:dihydroneopterin aldolase